MDVLDAENEDPFTLETLDSLIELHAEKGLDFIIARVTTVDPNEETRFYYSYYAAHHINKVLFRTQPEEGLLHRMKAKNPLNNMTIVGDVHYYVVKAESVQRKPKKPMSAVPKSPYDVLKMMIPQTDTQIRNANIRNHFRSKTGDSAEGFGGLTQLLNITTGQSVPLQFVINNNAFENEEFELQERLRNAKGSKPGEFSVESRRNSFDDAYSDMSPIVRPSTTIKLNMPKDTENRHRPVRSNAFANERTNSMSIDDWIRLQKQKLPSNVPKSAFVGSTISEKIPTVSSPRRRSQRTETTTPTPTVTFAEEKTDELYYEAHYHSSDDDFLLHGNIRSYFKKNALESSDSILFTIATNNTSSQLPPGDVHAHPTLANLSFLLGEEDGEAFAILKRNKFLKWLILGYIAMAIFVVRFLVPPSHAYIVGLTFFFFFCLFLIITL
ncbi:hypothetical protein BC833DRAFT_530981 [Globomyces pollinis-pini]|nr:hypothetical protein BC833DRAFT_530981 [Globomyces pollinis-pini]